MTDRPEQSHSAEKITPGDNPNKLNARPRQGARPKTKNAPTAANQSMRLGWIDPLPKVDSIIPLGLDPNPEAIPAGEIELRFTLPGSIAEPFASVVHSVGDRIQITEDEKEEVADHVRSLGYFKAARQLYSTMLDNEKAVNQPLKAVYYDEMPVPSHMGAALGIIGHMDTKVGKVLVQDAGVLFKRWVAKGLEIDKPGTYTGDPSTLVWPDRDSYKMIQRLSRDRIAAIVKQTYQVTVGANVFTVSMPQLTTQSPQAYYQQINNNVPQADDLRHLVSALEMTYVQYKDDTIPNGVPRGDILGSLALTLATGPYEVGNMREAFEEWTAEYNSQYRWRVESIFTVGPPPAGTTGYGAQTVSAVHNTARWQFPLADSDVNVGFMFSPVQEFKLYPRMIGYSQRDRSTAASAFAYQDGKPFTR